MSKVRIKGWCAFNKGIVPSIDEISFEEDYEKVTKKWAKHNQIIRKCTIIIEDDE